MTIDSIVQKNKDLKVFDSKYDPKDKPMVLYSHENKSKPKQGNKKNNKDKPYEILLNMKIKQVIKPKKIERILCALTVIKRVMCMMNATKE